MPIQRLNHAVLYIRNVKRSVEFYENVLGFRKMFELVSKAVFLQAPGSNNDHDLGLFEIGDAAGPSLAGHSTVGLYHLAWEVDTLGELERLARILADHEALVGASDHGTTKALYARDPDSIELEISWMLPANLITNEVLEARRGILPLDLPAEIARYGGDTLGGLGVSHA